MVIGRVGVYCGVVHVTPPKAWVTDNALVVKELDAAVRPRFLADALRHADLNRHSDQAAQPLISGKKIYPVPIIVPEEADQARYLSRVATVAQWADKATHGAAHLDTLFASLQQRAFAGEF